MPRALEVIQAPGIAEAEGGCSLYCVEAFGLIFQVQQDAHGPDFCDPTGRANRASREYDTTLHDMAFEELLPADRCRSVPTCECSFNATMRSYKGAWANNIDLCWPEQIAGRMRMQRPGFIVKDL